MSIPTYSQAIACLREKVAEVDRVRSESKLLADFLTAYYAGEPLTDRRVYEARVYLYNRDRLRSGGYLV